MVKIGQNSVYVIIEWPRMYVNGKHCLLPNRSDDGYDGGIKHKLDTYAIKNNEKLHAKHKTEVSMVKFGKINSDGLNPLSKIGRKFENKKL